jgi:hypothetical protein
MFREDRRRLEAIPCILGNHWITSPITNQTTMYEMQEARANGQSSLPCQLSKSSKRDKPPKLGRCWKSNPYCPVNDWMTRGLKRPLRGTAGSSTIRELSACSPRIEAPPHHWNRLRLQPFYNRLYRFRFRFRLRVAPVSEVVYNMAELDSSKPV